MRIGSHVSIAGSLAKAPANAARIGAEVFQIFSRSPHGGPVKPITPDLAAEFASEKKKYKLGDFYIHTPYFINFSSIQNNIYYGSISVVRQELDRGSQIGCRAVMTHLGSFGELTDAEGLKLVAKAIGKVMEGYEGSTQLLLEISAGAGRVVGDTFEEIAAILENKILAKYNIGVCFDTCHAFASGYDLRTKEAVGKTLTQFDKIIGLEKLVMVHANDSLADLGKHLDRHQHIGEGYIGLQGFKALVKHKTLNKLDWILETPKDNPENDKRNIAVLKKLL